MSRDGSHCDETPRPRWTLIGSTARSMRSEWARARALELDGTLTVERVTLGTAGESAAASVSQWIAGSEQFVSRSMHALGLACALRLFARKAPRRRAARAAADELFRAQTDKLVHAQLRKRPPERARPESRANGLARSSAR